MMSSRFFAPHRRQRASKKDAGSRARKSGSAVRHIQAPSQALAKPNSEAASNPSRLVFSRRDLDQDQHDPRPLTAGRRAANAGSCSRQGPRRATEDRDRSWPRLRNDRIDARLRVRRLDQRRAVSRLTVEQFELVPTLKARRHRTSSTIWAPTRKSGAKRDQGRRRALTPSVPRQNTQPDLNPIEQVFAKLKGLVRKAAPRTLDAVSEPSPKPLTTIPPDECANYLTGAGYASAHDAECSKASLAGADRRGRSFALLA